MHKFQNSRREVPRSRQRPAKLSAQPLTTTTAVSCAPDSKSSGGKIHEVTVDAGNTKFLHQDIETKADGARGTNGSESENGSESGSESEAGGEAGEQGGRD
ncbi:MAG: hypothetical protein M3007_07310 [Candidatus Eremiobacteraeota bacterium]|nr:hypothetical protein [Candidatus Eremiobacteraeota bacterium]